LRFRRGGPVLTAEPKADLFPAAIAPEAERLVAAYGLEGWRERAGRRDFAASLFYVQMLERAFSEAGVTLPDPLTVLDAGCSDWFYAPALHGLLRRWRASAPRALTFEGIELDAYRLYDDMHSRHDWASAYIEGLEGVTYRAMDVRRYDRPVELALMLYPFLFPSDHRRWGLPRRLLRPGDVLAHVAGCVRDGGWLVIANQGEAERERQHALLAELGLPIAWWAQHDSPLFDYDPARFVTVVGPIHRR
jgi:hypothetical protein